MADTRTEYLVEYDQDLWLTFLLDDPTSIHNPDTAPVALAAPVVSGLAPSTAAAQSAEQIVQVTGTGFTEISRVLWGGAAINTGFIGGTTLRVRVKPGAAGTVPVQVVNGSQKSNTVNFTVT